MPAAGPHGAGPPGTPRRTAELPAAETVCEQLEDGRGVRSRETASSSPRKWTSTPTTTGSVQGPSALPRRTGWRSPTCGPPQRRCVCGSAAHSVRGNRHPARSRMCLPHRPSTAPVVRQRRFSGAYDATSPANARSPDGSGCREDELSQGGYELMPGQYPVEWHFHDRGRGRAAYSPLAGGWLTGRGSRGGRGRGGSRRRR